MVASSLVPWEQWLAEINRTRSTGYRWRKDGLITTVNIFGKLYIEREEIARFGEPERARLRKRRPITSILQSRRCHEGTACNFFTLRDAAQRGI